MADFGIAHFLADAELSVTGNTRDESWDGTPSYMAPEQISGTRDRFCPATDIHALGAILYHMLTGMPTYHGATVLDTIEQVRNQEPVPPRRLIPQVPRDLETIALKCLEKHPSGRYASAEALADDLRRWLDGRPISARPVSPPERLWRGCRRRPVVAVLSTFLALSLAIGFGSVVRLWRQAESERRRVEAELRFVDRMLTEVSGLGHPGSAKLLVLPGRMSSRSFEEHQKPRHPAPDATPR